jgi:hypothetical protein
MLSRHQVRARRAAWQRMLVGAKVRAQNGTAAMTRAGQLQPTNSRKGLSEEAAAQRGAHTVGSLGGDVEPKYPHSSPSRHSSFDPSLEQESQQLFTTQAGGG